MSGKNNKNTLNYGHPMVHLSNQICYCPGYLLLHYVPKPSSLNTIYYYLSQFCELTRLSWRVLTPGFSCNPGVL